MFGVAHIQSTNERTVASARVIVIKEITALLNDSCSLQL